MKKIVALFLAVIMLLSSAALAEGMTAGTYQASAQGYHGSIVLKVTVDADKITGIEVVEPVSYTHLDVYKRQQPPPHNANIEDSFPGKILW